MRDRGKIMATFSILFLVIIVVLIVVKISEATRHDMLYTELGASNVYAKSGFLPSYAEITDPGQTDWDLIFSPEHTGRFSISHLPVPESSRGRHSMFNPYIENFTILVPLNIEPETFEMLTGTIPVYPALYLNGIGENWEIFINGNLIASEVYQDENGNIYRYRSMRDVSIQFCRSFLNEGENVILFHVIGARPSVWIGFPYTSIGYIGDSRSVLRDFGVIATLVICTLFVVTGLYHLLIFFLRREDKYTLLFGAFASLSALYYFSRTPLIYYVIQNTEYTQRLEYLLLYFLVLSGVSFFEMVNFGKILVITKIYAAFCSVLAISQYFFSIYFAYGLLLIWQVCSVFYLIYFICHDLVWPLMRDISKRRVADRANGVTRSFWRLFSRNIIDTESGNIFALALIIACTAIFDVLDAAFFHMGIMLTFYGYIGFLLLMTYVLARKSAHRHEQAEQENISLEEIVKQRTALLEEQIIIAEEASLAKSVFLAKMSHEIRTPMNAIIGMTELALRDEVPAATRSHILTIHQAGDNLLSIINDILDFSKIQMKKLEISPVEYSFASLINDVVNMIRVRAEASRLQFVVSVDSHIPDLLIGDPVRIQQILLNLLSNAVKYTEKGHISFTITGEITETDEIILTVEVSDTGRGVRPEDMDKLFHDFVQLDAVSNRGIEGTGLGLTITRSLVNIMGGKISVTSEYGAGSTFTVTLPQKFTNPARLAFVNAPEQKSVIVLAKDEACASCVMSTLTNLGVECAKALNVSEFYENMAEKPYPFVFVSPGLYESARRICRAFKLKPKIVILAEFGETVDIKRSRILYTPVYSIPVAGILNEADEGGGGREQSVRFIAPSAKILVVDDINTNLMVAEGLLLPYQMQVELCASGMEAIEKITSDRFDLVFMDHMMPEMDGIEAVAHIRSLGERDPHYTNLPVIAFTAAVVSGMKEMFLQNGFNDFLSKPIDTVELNAILEKWIHKDMKIDQAVEGGGLDDGSGGSGRHDLKQITGGLEIQGVNVQKGLMLTGGNLESYLETLAVFYKDGTEKIAEIPASLKSNDLNKYKIYVHALKSASASIGAEMLPGMANALETAARQNDLKFIHENTGRFISDLQLLLHSIDAALAAQKGETYAFADLQKLEDGLTELAATLRALDSAGIDAAAECLKEFSHIKEAGSSVEAILHDVLIGSYEEALELIEKLLDYYNARERFNS